LFKGTVHGEVPGEPAGANFGAAEKCVIDAKRERGTEKVNERHGRECAFQGLAEFGRGQQMSSATGVGSGATGSRTSCSSRRKKLAGAMAR
jgi:hypothetical protein